MEEMSKRLSAEEHKWYYYYKLVLIVLKYLPITRL